MTTQVPPVRHTARRLRTFHALPVRDVPPPGAPWPADATAAGTAWRLAVEPLGTGPSEDVAAALGRFLDSGAARTARALVVGAWHSEVYAEDSARVVRLLAAAADRLPTLRALFLGDLVAEEAEVSWLGQSDVTPLLHAYPRLEELVVRGGHGLGWQPVRHAALRRLVCEGDGLSGAVVRAIGASDLPALASLDLWLGAPEHGGTASPGDLAGVFGGAGLGALRHLGLRNRAAGDAIAAAVATAPVVRRLRTLSLAGCRIGDRGAEALLRGRPLAHLHHLDLRQHALSEDMARRLLERLTDLRVPVDLSGGFVPDPGVREGWLYAAVDE